MGAAVFPVLATPWVFALDASFTDPRTGLTVIQEAGPIRLFGALALSGLPFPLWVAGRIRSHGGVSAVASLLASLLTPATGTQDAAAAALAQLGFADLDQACAALGGEADEEVAQALAILGTHCERSDDYPRSVLLRWRELHVEVPL